MTYLQEDLIMLSAELERQQLGGHTLLVTGATGLIGSLCIKAVAQYNVYHKDYITVFAMARSKEKVQAVFAEDLEKGTLNQVKFVYQDICEPIADNICCDYIIHTASSTTSRFFMTNPVEVIESIYTGTKRILDFAMLKQVKGVVYLSSMEVFGQVDCAERISEDQLGYLDIHSIRSCYSEGKRLAELLCTAYANEYQIPVKIARLAQTFGAGVFKTDNRVFAQFARSALRGENIVLHTKGQSIGNYCYTTDAIRALFLLLKDGDTGEAYTVVNEETTRTIEEMAQLVVENFSKGKSKVIFDISERNQFGYAPDTKMRLSSKKLRNLGWRPEIGLKEMYQRMMPSLDIGSI